MNPLGELLSSDDILVDVDVSTKEQVLRKLASLLAARHGIPESVILDGMHTREELGSTGVGHGVAIPHARMTQCSAAAAAFVRTKTGIPFAAPDGKPVSVFLGLIVPNMANERHLQLLATAAGMLGDRAFRDKLRACADPAAVKDLLTAWPDEPPGGAGASA